MALFVGTRILFSIALFAMMLGFADAQDRRQNAPGQFDYYVLSLSWSPSFCETATGNARRQQCGPRPFSFVVHGLWPQYERGFPESCQVPPPRLERNITTSMLMNGISTAHARAYNRVNISMSFAGLAKRW
jgi:ribonuclease T2